mgnify:CR=1 FL=1
MTPVYLTSTYVQERPGEIKGFDYSRTCNPTRTALEGNLAALEGGKHGLCFASGVAAITQPRRPTRGAVRSDSQPATGSLIASNSRIAIQARPSAARLTPSASA